MWGRQWIHGAQCLGRLCAVQVFGPCAAVMGHHRLRPPPKLNRNHDAPGMQTRIPERRDSRPCSYGRCERHWVASMRTDSHTPR